MFFVDCMIRKRLGELGRFASTQTRRSYLNLVRDLRKVCAGMPPVGESFHPERRARDSPAMAIFSLHMWARHSLDRHRPTLEGQSFNRVARAASPSLPAALPLFRRRGWSRGKGSGKGPMWRD